MAKGLSREVFQGPQSKRQGGNKRNGRGVRHHTGMVSSFPGTAFLSAPGVDPADGRTGDVQRHQELLSVLPLGGPGLMPIGDLT